MRWDNKNTGRFYATADSVGELEGMLRRRIRSTKDILHEECDKSLTQGSNLSKLFLLQCVFQLFQERAIILDKALGVIRIGIGLIQ